MSRAPEPVDENSPESFSRTAATAIGEGGVPRHIAIIMDGNNRWAKQRRLPGISGHKAGVEAIRKVLSACDMHGVDVLTLFAFSSENWQRPADEVGALMSLLLNYLQREVRELHKKGVRLRFIGKRDRLNPEIVAHMERAEKLTCNNTARTLVLAIDYGGQWDIANAAAQIARRAVDGELDVAAIDEALVEPYMALSDLQAPDLCIRTGGEYRISNFLLWQLSYAELYFTDCFWPDFDELELTKAIAAYASRQRRFGKTSEQLQESR